MEPPLQQILQSIILQQGHSSLSQTDDVLHVRVTEGNELLLHETSVEILLNESHHPLVHTLQFQ